MNVLIIGGGGFIGSNIVEELNNDGHQVTVITRGSSKSLLNPNTKVAKLYGDRNDEGFMQSAADIHFDAVIDMTAYLEEDSKLVVKLFAGKTARFIQTSTVSVYMVSHDVRNPITEDQDNGEIMNFWEMNPFGMQYGIDKRKCEDVLWKAHHDNGFPVTFIRHPYVCGPHDPMMRDYFWIERILDGGPLLIPGSGDYASQHIFVGDLSRAFSDTLKYDHTIGQAYNIASEEIYSLNDYLDSLAILLGVNHEKINVDLDVFEELPFSTSPDGHAFPYNTYRTAIFSIDKAMKDFNYRSTPFQEWMPKVIEYYTNIYKRPSVGYSRRGEEINFLNKWKTEMLKFKQTVKLFSKSDSNNAV